LCAAKGRAPRHQNTSGAPKLVRPLYFGDIAKNTSGAVATFYAQELLYPCGTAACHRALVKAAQYRMAGRCITQAIKQGKVFHPPSGDLATMIGKSLTHVHLLF
jgi:hypothetical protein